MSNALYQQIVRGTEWENSQKSNLTLWGMLKDPVTRRRIAIGSSPGTFASIAGNIIATFYLGRELRTAGITDTTAQLKAVMNPPTPRCRL